MSVATIPIFDDEALVGWSLRERANRNQTQAAQVLGVNRDQVRSRIEDSDSMRART